MWKRLEISLSPGSLLWSAACVGAKSLSRARLFATPRTVVRQAPLSVGFSRQDYWTGGWRRVLRVPWTARRSNQSILKEINPSTHWKDWCWSGNCSPLATWCEELTHWKRPWCWERWKAGGEGDDRGWDGWMTSLTRWTWGWASSRTGDGQGSLACCSLWGCKESDTTEWLK